MGLRVSALAANDGTLWLAIVDSELHSIDFFFFQPSLFVPCCSCRTFRRIHHGFLDVAYNADGDLRFSALVSIRRVYKIMLARIALVLCFPREMESSFSCPASFVL